MTETVSEAAEEIDTRPKLKFSEIMFVKKSFFANGANLVGNMFLAYNLPTYSTHMVRDEPSCNAAVFGIMMAVSAIFFALQQPFSTRLIVKLSRRWVMYIGLVLLTISGVVMAFDFGAPIGVGAKAGFSILGMSILGFGLGFVLIPGFPEVLNAIERNA